MRGVSHTVLLVVASSACPHVDTGHQRDIHLLRKLNSCRAHMRWPSDW